MAANAIAALSLGIMPTKDHTVQAALRLPQLAISKAAVFFAPPEVYQSILNYRHKTGNDQIDSADVVIIEQLQPLYVSQGMEYCRRQIYSQQHPHAVSDPEQRRAFLRLVQQPERYSLEDLFAVNHKIKTKIRPGNANSSPNIQDYFNQLDVIRKGMRDTGDVVQALAHLEVEQEREIQIEVEPVREVKTPHLAQPLAQPPLHREVRSFAPTGRLAAGSYTYEQAFASLRHTEIGRGLPISESATQSKLFVTRDFSNTVVTYGRPRDEYCRPVHWIFWSPIVETALVISDYEADAVLPLIRYNTPPSTHLMNYAAPVTRSVLVFDTLNFYTVPRLPESWRAPSWLVRDLG